jgi:hypothetical protein
MATTSAPWFVAVFVLPPRFHLQVAISSVAAKVLLIATMAYRASKLVLAGLRVGRCGPSTGRIVVLG